MHKRSLKISIFITIMVLTVAFMHFFDTSHTTWYASQHNQTEAISHSNRLKSSHLTIVYERTYLSKHDLISLQVDSLYRDIKKAGFTYKTVCDRTYTLKNHDGQELFDISHLADACFVHGGNLHEWQPIDKSCIIQNYPCQLATTNIDGIRYEAWYSDALPHCHDNAQPTDQLNGLIMELRSLSNDYSLKIKHITQYNV